MFLISYPLRLLVGLRQSNILLAQLSRGLRLYRYVAKSMVQHLQACAGVGERKSWGKVHTGGCEVSRVRRIFFCSGGNYEAMNICIQDCNATEDNWHGRGCLRCFVPDLLCGKTI